MQVAVLDVLVEVSRIFVQVYSHLCWRSSTLFGILVSANIPFCTQHLGCYLEPMENSAALSTSKRSFTANKRPITQGGCMKGKDEEPL